MNALATRRLGRFELRRELGRGAQARVWLAHDPRLEREVAVKLLDPNADAVAVGQWLHEARAVSRLSHPNVVPLFEADESNGASYLVFEYVDGPTLAAALRRRGAWPLREAAVLVGEVLDALAAAHAQGIVHRDLKPSNVLLGADGRPRVMDFGIAARVSGGADGRIVGTPGYMSPEAARGAAPSPSMDVFAAGALLAELLSGERLLAERDPYAAIRRVLHEDLELPAAVEVDETLRGIVNRALARDVRKRYDGAAAMRDALGEWLRRTDVASGHAGPVGHGTLEFLLRRMRHKSDFPALSDSVVRIQRVASSDTESLASLAAEVLKDVALTNKLLRVVNSAHFGLAAGGSISTVSRAAALIGFAGIRNLALSLVLLEHMRDKSHAVLLKEEFLRALTAATLAAELAPTARDGEDAFLATMFQNLGRLLTEYYFPEEALQIRQQLAATPDAAARVLGIGFDELGIGVARAWGFPETLQRVMRAPAGDAPSRPVETGSERQRWLARLANELADVLLTHDADTLPAALHAHTERYAAALGLAPPAVAQAVNDARARLADLSRSMGLELAAGARARRLVQADAPVADSLAPHRLQPTAALESLGAPAPPADGSLPVADLLAAGIQDITNTMVAENFRLNEVLRMVLETMYRALGFQRVVFCLREPKTATLTGRFGLGHEAEAVAGAFRVALKPGATPDLFAAICAKSMDTLIADARQPNIAARLPAWFRERVGAPAFLLLPLALKGATFALIYADMRAPGAIELGEKELSLLRTLRNQAVMAFRHAGG